MRKRVTRLAACVLAGVMAVQLAGCGSKKVDYTLDGDGISGGYSESDDGGRSGLSEIRCTADKVDVPDTDKLKKVYYTTTKLDAKQRQTIVEGLLDRSQGIYVRKEGVSTKDELKNMIE